MPGAVDYGLDPREPAVVPLSDQSTKSIAADYSFRSWHLVLPGPVHVMLKLSW